MTRRSLGQPCPPPPPPPRCTGVKIVSWNINSVRFRIAIVEQFLREVEPDILCLQETKVVDADFPFDAFRASATTISSSTASACTMVSRSSAACR